MRLRSEATGGYDYGGLIAIGLVLLGAALAGLVMLAVAAWRHLRGQPPGWLLGWGFVLVLPLLITVLLSLG